MTAPTQPAVRRAAATLNPIEWPACMATLRTMPLTPIVEPTERSMPPVTITAVMPSATIATKAKLRVTLKRFCGVAKVLVASDRTMQAMSVASTIQNVCCARSALHPECVV